MSRYKRENFFWGDKSILSLTIFMGCAFTVRELYKVDESLPIGNI